jgi:hypothetical protein
MKINALAFVILLAILLGFNAESPAQQVYKYVDENGVPHFTNAPNDPRYKRGPKTVNRKTTKKQKRLKSGKYSASMLPKQSDKVNQPSASPTR